MVLLIRFLIKTELNKARGHKASQLFRNINIGYNGTNYISKEDKSMKEKKTPASNATNNQTICLLKSVVPEGNGNVVLCRTINPQDVNMAPAISSAALANLS